jgi:hypothetical protein
MTKTWLWGICRASISVVGVQFVGLTHFMKYGSHRLRNAVGYTVWIVALGVAKTGMNGMVVLDSSMNNIADDGSGTFVVFPPRNEFR